MANWHENRISRFLALVNLDELPPPPSPETGVAVDWRTKMGHLAGWDTTGWELFFQHVRAESGEGYGQWGWKRGQEQLAIRIFVSSHGVQPAREYFRRLAMSSTAPEYPYRRVPYLKEGSEGIAKEVVTFFVPSPSPDGQTHSDSVLRLFRNVVFDVRASDARISVLAVADDLMDFALQGSNFSLAENLPTIEPAGPPESLEPLLAALEEKSADLAWKEQPREGTVQVIDRRTLLSRTLDIPGI